GQAAVLAKQENFALFRPQIQNRPVQPLLRFSVKGARNRTATLGFNERRGTDQGSGAPPPGIALQVLGSVEPDAKNPGAQVPNFTNPFPVPPAFDKSVLGGILRILVV